MDYWRAVRAGSSELMLPFPNKLATHGVSLYTSSAL